jgi:hypothetical protein
MNVLGGQKGRFTHKLRIKAIQNSAIELLKHNIHDATEIMTKTSPAPSRKVSTWLQLVHKYLCQYLHQMPQSIAVSESWGGSYQRELRYPPPDLDIEGD